MICECVYYDAKMIVVGETMAKGYHVKYQEMVMIHLPMLYVVIVECLPMLYLVVDCWAMEVLLGCNMNKLGLMKSKVNAFTNVNSWDKEFACQLTSTMLCW